MSWQVDADLSSAGELNAPPPRTDGVYKVRIGPSELTTTSSGKKRVRWTNTVIEGPCTGCGIWDGLMLPTTGVEKSDKFFNDQWYTLFRALGLSHAKIGKIKVITGKLIEGKELYVKYIAAKMKGADSDVTHLLPNLVETTVHAMKLNTTVTEDLMHDDDIQIDMGSSSADAPPEQAASDDLDDLFV